MTINPDMPVSYPQITGSPERVKKSTDSAGVLQDSFIPSQRGEASIRSMPAMPAVQPQNAGASTAPNAADASAGANIQAGNGSGAAVSIDKAAEALLDKTEAIGSTHWQTFLDRTYTRSMPAVGADGTIYSISAGGHLAALKDGKELWACELDHNYGGSKDDKKDEFKRGSAPVIGPDNTVYTISHGGYASAVKDGKLLWACDLDHTYDGMTPSLGPDGTLCSVSAGGYASAVKNGKVIWQCDLNHNYEGSSSVVGPDGTLYALSAGGYASAVKNGKVMWEHLLNHNYEGSSPAVGPDGTMYALSAGGYASAVKDGKVTWEHFLDHNYKRSSPAVGPDGTMYTLSAGGYAGALKDGKVVWEHFLDHNYEGSSPAVREDGTVFTLSAGGYTGALKDGNVMWERFLDHNYEGSSPVLSSDGSQIISLSAGGYLTSIKGRVTVHEALQEEDPENVKDKPTIEQQDDYIIVDGVSLPVDRK
jgi:ribosomal protein L27